MQIQFVHLLIKAEPASTLGINVSLAENDPTITKPNELENTAIDYNSLTVNEKAIVNNFINLLKSKAQ